MSAETGRPREPRMHISRDDEVLFDVPQARTHARGDDEVLADVLDLEGLRSKPEKQPILDSKTVSPMLTQLGLGIEDRVALLENPTVAKVLKESGTVANQDELLTDLEEAARLLKEKLESRGLKFGRDGSVVDDIYYAAENQHKDSEDDLNTLRILFDLTDERLGAIDHTTGGKGGRIEEPDELDFASYQKAKEVVLAKRQMTPEEERRAEAGRTQDMKRFLFDDLNRSGIRGNEYLAALDADVLEELSLADYRGNMLTTVAEAVGKVIRATENRVGFVLDENGEPVLLSILDKINFFTKGKKIAAAKKTLEYGKLIGLMNLQEKLVGVVGVTKKNLEETQLVRQPQSPMQRLQDIAIPKTAFGRAAVALGAGVGATLGAAEGIKQLRNKQPAEAPTPVASRGPDSSLGQVSPRVAEDEVGADFLREQRQRIEEMFKRDTGGETQRSAAAPEQSAPAPVAQAEEAPPTPNKPAAKKSYPSTAARAKAARTAGVPFREPKISTKVANESVGDALTAIGQTLNETILKGDKKSRAEVKKTIAHAQETFGSTPSPEAQKGAAALEAVAEAAKIITGDNVAAEKNRQTIDRFLGKAKKKLSPELTGEIELAPDMKAVEKILKEAILKEAKAPKTSSQLLIELNRLRKTAAEQAADEAPPEPHE